jgi:thioredoxin 1
MAIDSVIHTTQQSIDRVLRTGLPVVLIFWQADHPLNATNEAQLNQLAQQYAGQALLAKVDARTEQAVVQRFAVQQLPAVVFIKQGNVQGTLLGNPPGTQLTDWLRYLVQGGAKPTIVTTNKAVTSSDGSATPRILTDANFQQVIGGPGPVLVDFWAPWCGPCRMVAPAIEQLAREFQGRAVIAKLNVDENPQTAQRYQVMSIPALYIFKAGRVVDQLIGAQPLAILQQRLTKQLVPAKS